MKFGKKSYKKKEIWWEKWEKEYCEQFIKRTFSNYEEAFDVYVWARRRNLYPVITPTMISGHLKNNEEWKKILSDEEYRVLIEKGTEYPGTGEYNIHMKEGVYNCKKCKKI